MTCRALPTSSAGGILSNPASSRSNGSGLEGVERRAHLFRIVATIVHARRLGTSEIIGEPDYPGRPKERHPPTLEDRAEAHREHARDCRPHRLRLRFLVFVRDLAMRKSVANASIKIDALRERAAERVGDFLRNARIDVA